jgi:hypothetical protein
LAERTVGDIVLACQEQQPVTELELRHALLCLYYDGQLAASSDFATASPLKLQMRAKENFERRFRMLRAAPAAYLGEGFKPGTEENSKRRELGKRLIASLQKRGDLG